MILFIDDEIRRMKNYVEELKENQHPVEFINKVDDVLVLLEDKDQLDKIDLVIMDVMMPPGERLQAEETEYGLSTGICLYKEFRKVFKEVKPDLPIIIFTNVPNEELATEIKDDRVLLLQKEDFFPYELMNEVEKMLKAENRKKEIRPIIS